MHRCIVATRPFIRSISLRIPRMAGHIVPDVKICIRIRKHCVTWGEICRSYRRARTRRLRKNRRDGIDRLTLEIKRT